MRPGGEKASIRSITWTTRCRGMRHDEDRIEKKDFPSLGRMIVEQT
jgi:hypothetical protein